MRQLRNERGLTLREVEQASVRIGEAGPAFFCIMHYHK
jgi:hypothetical protein